MENGHLATVLNRIHATLDRVSSQMDGHMSLISTLNIEQARMAQRMEALEAKVNTLETTDKRRAMAMQISPALMMKALLAAAIGGMIVMEWVPPGQIASLISLAR